MHVPAVGIWMAPWTHTCRMPSHREKQRNTGWEALLMSKHNCKLDFDFQFVVTKRKLNEILMKSSPLKLSNGYLLLFIVEITKFSIWYLFYR